MNTFILCYTDTGRLVASTPKPKKNVGASDDDGELQKKLDEQEKQFELVKADLLMEKEALEEVLVKLRQDLRQREEAASQLQEQLHHRDQTITILQHEKVSLH